MAGRDFPKIPLALYRDEAQDVLFNGMEKVILALRELSEGMTQEQILHVGFSFMKLAQELREERGREPAEID